MAQSRQMQMMVTRFERLTRRISLAGIMSGKSAKQAISEGRVFVDGKVATANFKVFTEVDVSVDGIEVPPPADRPKLWGVFKPRNVLCHDLPERPPEEAEQMTAEEKKMHRTLRSVMAKWHETEVRKLGDHMSVGLAREYLVGMHYVTVCGLSHMADGLVLMTNDGLFAKALQQPEQRILTEFSVRIAGDPPVQLLHRWKKRARAAGIEYGPVFSSLSSRNAESSRLRLRYVETPRRPIEALLEQAKMRAHRIRREAFGPYLASQFPMDRVVQLPIKDDFLPLIPKPDIRRVLVPTRGNVLDESGRIRSISLEGSAILEDHEDDEDDDEPHVASEGSEHPATKSEVPVHS